MKAQKHAHQPCIIWTLQRTGGTNLTQRLVELAGIEATQHEPFNVGRKYGDVTQAWIAHQDEAALNRSILGIVAQMKIIKHCVEMVPFAVTRSLAQAAMQAGYKHFFLYREQARDRLLSLHFAKKTGVWGPNMNKGEIEEEKLSETIPITHLIKHEEQCVANLRRTWNYLNEGGVRPMALSYEQIYRVSPAEAEIRLRLLLEYLGLAHSRKSAHKFVLDVLGKGDQGTRDKYRGFPGIDDFEQALHGVSVFEPVEPNRSFAIVKAEMPGWIVRAQLDTLPNEIESGKTFLLAGVIVTDQAAPAGISLCLKTPEGEEKLSWDIDSPKMRKLYPEAQNSAKARFKSNEFKFAADREYQLILKSESGDTFVLFNIKTQQQTDEAEKP